MSQRNGNDFPPPPALPPTYRLLYHQGGGRRVVGRGGTGKVRRRRPRHCSQERVKSMKLCKGLGANNVDPRSPAAVFYLWMEAIDLTDSRRRGWQLTESWCCRFSLSFSTTIQIKVFDLRWLWMPWTWTINWRLWQIQTNSTVFRTCRFTWCDKSWKPGGNSFFFFFRGWGSQMLLLFILFS